jgi:predicted DNA-binding ribbon-helix-helix protein
MQVAGLAIVAIAIGQQKGERRMKSSISKRSIVLAGHKTSVSLEDAFWSSLKEIASRQQTTLSQLVADIDRHRDIGNLSSSLRLFVLEQVQSAVRAASAR